MTYTHIDERQGLGFLPPAIAASSAGGPAAMAITAAVTGIVMGLKMFFGRKGPKQKVAATHIVDPVEKYLQENLRLFNESYKTAEDKANALAVFDYAWAGMVDKLNNEALGDPGQRGISERSRGGRWDWFAYYRDPIENTPVTSTVDAMSEYFGTNGSNMMLYVGLGALVLGGLFMMGGDSNKRGGKE